MHDRGEKIVSLAREILRSDVVPTIPEPTPARITLSFKMLCLATVLTAVGSSAVTSVVIENRRPLNKYEKTELAALLFYTAREKGLSEDILRHEIIDNLQIPNFDAMTQHDFLAARTYLQDKAN